MTFSKICRVFLSLPLLVLSSAALQLSAQAQPQSKPFDVVSIRQNVASASSGPRDLVASPDGFRVVRQPLQNILLTAYTPEAGGMFLNRIEQMPDWMRHERYDIDARISEAERSAWNDPTNQPAMLQAKLQSMFQSRFKLVVHREIRTVPVFDLVIAKSGAKFTGTKPDESEAASAMLPGGGRMGENPDGATHLSNFSMGLLAGLLSSKSDRPVLDKTGLTGRYTLNIREPQRMAAPSVSPNGDSEEERMPAVADALKAVGLELKSAKEQVEYLVIDHVERPTEN